jgi:hypothetical protein
LDEMLARGFIFGVADFHVVIYVIGHLNVLGL